jgi:hypothetical protein
MDCSGKVPYMSASDSDKSKLLGSSVSLRKSNFDVGQ